MDKDKMDNYRPEEGTEEFRCDAPKLCMVQKGPKEITNIKTWCAAIWLGIFVCLMEFPHLKGYTFRRAVSKFFKFLILIYFPYFWQKVEGSCSFMFI